MEAPRKIAIVATYADACGGSEGRALELYSMLAPHAAVELWTDFQPDPALAQRWPIQQVDERRGHHPRGADLVFVGAPRFGRWVKRADAGRITLIYNSDTPERLARRLRKLRRVPKRDLRLVFASESLASTVPHAGTVQLSPIDLARFRPAPRTWSELRVGRLSRDTRYKHGSTDPDLYRRLAAEGIAVRVRGGTCLADEVGDVAGVELTPASPVAPEAFLQELDVFVYRTRDDWYEASARVVVEALACGLPILAHRRGGYLDYLVDGENALLFDDDDGALRAARRLRDDPQLLARMKTAARASAERIYSAEALTEIVSFYLAE